MTRCPKHEWTARQATAIRQVRECQCGAVEHRRVKDVPQGETRGAITDEERYEPWRRGEW